jgi:hypothetical protein
MTVRAGANRVDLAQTLAATMLRLGLITEPMDAIKDVEPDAFMLIVWPKDTGR